MSQHRNGRNGNATDGLIDAFYDTAIATTEGCAWCDVLPKVCSAFKTSAGSFLVHDFAMREGALRHEFNILPKFRDAYNEGLAAINPWMESPAFYEEGAVVRGEDILPDDDLVETEFYSRYLEPQGLRRHLCGVITQDGQNAYLISLFRSPEAPPFQKKDKEALSKLLPHLKRSVMMRDRVVRDRLARETFAGTMDLLPVAFLLVGRSGRVELRNRVANKMIARKDGIFIGAGGYLATASAKNTVALRGIIREIADADSDGECLHSNEHFIISRGNGRLPLICAIYPVSDARRNDEQGSDRAVAVLIKDPQVERLDGLPDFVSVYKLTNAEAGLIRLLTTGQGLFESAGELGITKNTVRTHMRNIYSKVGTHRQADLIRIFTQFSMF